jgi:hypothetical protein
MFSQNYSILYTGEKHRKCSLSVYEDIFSEILLVDAFYTLAKSKYDQYMQSVVSY